MTPLIIIPAYNEEKTLGRIIEDIKKSITGADILVVSDGSTDKTAQIAKERNVKVAVLPFNLGYGVTLQTGFRYALEYGYDFIVHLDADGQHDVNSINLLLSEIRKGQADIVIGSRFLDNPDYPFSFPRRVGIWLFKAVIKLITKQKITDPTSGFQALNRRAFEFYAYNYPGDYPDTDIILTAFLAGFKIKEIAVKFYPKPFGKSMHSGLRPLYYVFKMFLSIFVTLFRRDNKG